MALTKVSSSLVSDSAVTSGKIADGGIATVDIADVAVTSAKIANNAILTQHIDDAQVTTDQLGADAVTAAKIADDAISEEHLDITVITSLTAVTAATGDLLMVADVSDSNNLKKIPVSSILAGTHTGAVNTSGTINSGAITSSGAIESTSLQTSNIYLSTVLYTLNAAGNGWDTTINRNSGSPTANLPGGITSGAITSGTISSGTITSSGNVVLDAAGHNYIELHSATANTRKWRFYNGQSWNPDALLIYDQDADSTALTIETNKLGINRGAGSLSHTLDVGGNIAISGTEIIDNNKNMSNLGTINSGAITSSGPITVNNVNDTYNFKAIAGDTDSWFGVYDDANNSANIIVTRSDGATSFQHLGHSGATTINGTLSSGAITSTGITLSTTYPKLQLNDTTGVDRNFSVGTNNETFTIRNETAGSDSFTIYNDNNATFAGTINSGAITSSGNSTFQGATTTIGSAAANINVELNLKGVASKATRIQFQEGNTSRWLLGQGAASETSAFELYNSAGTIALSVNRSSNFATFGGGIIGPSIAISGAASASTLLATNTADATGLSFRSTAEIISGEGWATAHYHYNNNDGTLFLNRTGAGAAHPVFHIGGYNNVSYHPSYGYSEGDAGMVTLVKPNGTKNAGQTGAYRAVSSTADYSNWIKEGTKTLFHDSDGQHEFNGSVSVTDSLVVNANYTGNNYLWLRQANNGDGGIVFSNKKADNSLQNNWQLVPSTSSRTLLLYSYTMGAHHTHFNAGGGIYSLNDGGTSSAFFMAGNSAGAANGKVAMSLRDGMTQFRDPADYYHKMWYYDGINISTNSAHGHFRVWGDSDNSVMNASSGENTIRFSVDTVTGNIGTSDGATNIYNASDERLKENVSTLPSMLNKIKDLRPISYDWKYKDGETGIYGFIAQEVQEVDASLVFNSGDTGYRNDKNYGEDLELDGTIEDTLAINERKLFPMLVKALQEQQTIIDDLKSRIETLEG